MEDQFYIVLPSNSSMDVYPNNTTACFTVNLPQEIRLKGEWEVGISEIHYPLTFLHLQEKHAKVSIQSENPPDTPSDYQLSHGLFTDMDDFLYNINEDFKQKKIEVEFFKHSAKSGYVCVHRRCDSGTPAEKGCPLYLRAHRNFYKILGFEGSKNLNDNGIYVTKDVEGKGAVTGVRPANILNAIPRQLFIYTDITEPLIVGNVKTSLLRIVPVHMKNFLFGHNHYQTFAPIKYIPLLTSSFCTITIDVRNEIGEPIPFEFGTLTVTLHFRRKN